MSLTFRPLAGNWYRVMGTGLPKAPKIKKAAIKGYSRGFYGRQRARTAAALRPPIPSRPLPRARMFGGWADCPTCRSEQPVAGGDTTCRACNARFYAYRPW